MKAKFAIFGFLIFGLFTTIGCGPGDREARRKQAKAMLVSMRRSIDLNGPEIPDILVGDTAPETTGVSIEGEAIAVSDHGGQVVLLSFWGGG